jgi:hypothetical protein
MSAQNQLAVKTMYTLGNSYTAVIFQNGLGNVSIMEDCCETKKLFQASNPVLSTQFLRFNQS